MAPQIEANYRLRYRQGGFTLGDIRIQVCELSLFAAFGYGKGKECFPKTIARPRFAKSPANVVCQIRRGSCSLSRGDTSAEPITFYLNMPPMTEAKKIIAATRSNPATIFLSRVTLRS